MPIPLTDPETEERRFEVEINKPFKWRRGLCLSPTTPVTIVFPGRLIGNEETIGAILEASHDADIAFRPAAGTEEIFEFITIKLEPHMFLRLHRNTEAVVVRQTNGRAAFIINANCP